MIYLYRYFVWTKRLLSDMSPSIVCIDNDFSVMASIITITYSDISDIQTGSTIVAGKAHHIQSNCFHLLSFCLSDSLHNVLSVPFSIATPIG